MLLFFGFLYVESGELFPGQGNVYPLNGDEAGFDEKVITVQDMVRIIPAQPVHLPSKLGGVLNQKGHRATWSYRVMTVPDELLHFSVELIEIDIGK